MAVKSSSAATYILHLVLLGLDCSIPASGAATKNMPEGCSLSPSDYRASAVCKAENIAAWKKNYQQTVQGNAEQCKYDRHTGELTCSHEASCEGGEDFYDDVAIRNLQVTFDCETCDKQVGGVQLRPACCEACKKLKKMADVKEFEWKNKKPDEVVCAGCDSASLKKLVKDNPNRCTFKDNKFKCQAKESCKMGKGVESVTDNSYICKVTPCDACPNAAFKAECCSQCLQHACFKDDGSEDTPSDGKKLSLNVCTGCEIQSSSWRFQLFVWASSLLLLWSVCVLLHRWVLSD